MHVEMIVFSEKNPPYAMVQFLGSIIIFVILILLLCNHITETLHQQDEHNQQLITDYKERIKKYNEKGRRICRQYESDRATNYLTESRALW